MYICIYVYIYIYIYIYIYMCVYYRNLVQSDSNKCHLVGNDNICMASPSGQREYCNQLVENNINPSGENYYKSEQYSQ